MRFPKFFEDALGPMVTVEIPGELTPDEEEALNPEGRSSEDSLIGVKDRRNSPPLITESPHPLRPPLGAA